MPASYPTSVKTFTTKTDGVDDVLASHINDAQLEITAIETELGAAPSGTQFSTVVARLNAIDNGTLDVLWTAYHSSSTVVGWSSFSSKLIYYKKIGDLVHVAFNLNGTSNSTSASFTVPYAASLFNAIVLVWVTDNGVIQADPGYLNLAASSSTVNIYKTTAAAAWTASGGKEIYGQFFYRTAS